MTDQSVRSKNSGVQRLADTLLRATGGCVAVAQILATSADGTDAGQLGINAPVYQAVSLSPVNFRRTRPISQENQVAKYELLVSASAVQQQVGVLQLASPEALFMQIAILSVGGLNLLIEQWACSINFGQPLLYRLILREAGALS